MDTRLVTRPPVQPPARVDSQPKTLGTETPETVVVRPIQTAPPSAASPDTPAPTTEKRFVASPRPPGYVFVMTDASSGAVLMQLPSEQSIKLRAYREALERAREEDRVELSVSA